MTKIDSIDLTGLNSMFSQFRTALAGSGQGGDLSQLVRVEGGQTAWDISEAMGPRTKGDATKKVDKDLRRTLTDKPRFENLAEDPGKQFSTYGAFTWLYAGRNFLVTIDDQDNRVDASADEALQVHYAARKMSLGNRWLDLGKRGKQHVLLLNRTRVKPSVFREVRQHIQASVGQLKASFAASADKLLPGKRIPAWVREQFGPVASNGKQILEEQGLKRNYDPSVVIGSRSKGVESNPKIRNAIQGVIKRREAILKQKLEKVVAGYTYDWNNGRIFRKRATTE